MSWPFKGATPSERVRDLRKAEECCRRARLCYEAKVAASVGAAREAQTHG